MQKAIKAAAKEQPTIETLFEGPIATVKISPKARRGWHPVDKRIRFFQYAVHMKGGCINVFLHCDDSTLIGKFVRCKVTVLQKTFADGRTYLHVDLHPVERNVDETHRLFIVPHTDVTVLDHWKVFQTDYPQGLAMIIIAGLTDQFPTKEIESDATVEGVTEQPPATSVAKPAGKKPLPARIELVPLPKKKATKPSKKVVVKRGSEDTKIGSFADLDKLLAVE